MKRVILVISICVMICSSISAKSLVGSLADKMISSIGGDILQDKVGSLNNLINTAEEVVGQLKNIDIDSLTTKMMRDTIAAYKEFGLEVPSNFESMSMEELDKWTKDNKDKIDKFEASLTEEQKEKLEAKALGVLDQARPVMDIAEEAKVKFEDIQKELQDFEPALNSYLANYSNLINGLNNGSIDITQYPEYQQALGMLPSVAEKYANGDKLGAFKELDNITGLFSESDAGKGLAALLESSEAINLGGYLSKIIKGFDKISGQGKLSSISESQLASILNSYISEYKGKLGIGSSSKNADVLKKALDKYTDSVTNFDKNANALNDLANSDIGNLIKGSLEGKGTDVLGDIMSKVSGVSKEDIQKSGVLNIIDNTAKAVGEAGISGNTNGFKDIAMNALKSIFGMLIK